MPEPIAILLTNNQGSFNTTFQLKEGKKIMVNIDISTSIDTSTRSMDALRIL